MILSITTKTCTESLSTRLSSELFPRRFFAEAEHLEVKNKASIILCELLFNVKMLMKKQIKNALEEVETEYDKQAKTSKA